MTPVENNLVKIIPVTDSLYTTVDLLYNEAGLAPPSGSRPWSIDEWYRVIRRLDDTRLSPSGERALDRIHERLRREQEYNIARGDTFQADLSFTVALEAYGHSNLDDFPEESDWVFGYTRRGSAAKLAGELDLGSWFYLYSDLEYRKNRYAHNESEDSADSSKIYNHHFSTNLHTLHDLDFESPYRAFFAVGGDRWNLAAGRDLMRWGHGTSGNFVLNDHLDFHDMLRFVSYHDRVKFEATYLFLEHSGWLEPDPDKKGDLLGRRENPTPGTRMFLAHRLEFRPLDWLSLALTENVMYQHDYVEPRFLNPAFIYHNLNNRSMFNAIASAEVEAVVLPGVTLLGQYSMYQARAPLEGGSQPDAMGYLSGYRVVRPWREGYLYHTLEGVYSDTYMYQRDLVDMKVIRRQFVESYRFELNRQFLGYPWGGDVVVLHGTVGYHEPEHFELTLDLFHLWRGEIGIDTEIEDTGDFDLDRQAPSGTVERMFRAGVEGRWTPWDTLSLFSRVDFVHVTNKNNEKSSPVWDFQYALGASWTLR